MDDDKPGRSLEKAVVRIQQMMDSNVVVKHHEYIEDRLGIRREFDVVIRGTAAGRPYLGVIECKDWNDKVGTPEVEAFVMKARSVNANLVLIVSKKGFSEPALTLAKHEGVGTLSLLPNDPEDAGFMLGLTWFAKCWRWGEWRVSFHPAVVGPAFEIGDVDKVLLDGKPVIAWFRNQYAVQFKSLTTEGIFPLNVTFKKPQMIDCDGTHRLLAGITVEAKRIMEKKQKWVRFNGDAFYDWNTGVATMPPGGNMIMMPFENHELTDWKDFDGDIDVEMKAEPKKFLVCCFFLISEQFEPEPDAIDLMAY